MESQIVKQIENRYWENNGKHNKEYMEMRAAQFEFSKATNSVFHRYYRFYNDGDAPSSVKIAIKYHGFEEASKLSYVAEFLNKIEEAVDKKIVTEYKRFQKLQNAGELK